jgi:N-methylhydantoinase B/oxoprolinase/acetone carboxylase alpha subunit
VSEEAIVSALADALEAAAASLRRRAALLPPDMRSGPQAGSAEERARMIHPMLGPRQAEVIRELEEYEPKGTSTGAIARGLGYDQANTHLTLQALMERGLVERDTSVHPHNYRLAPPLRGEAA